MDGAYFYAAVGLFGVCVYLLYKLHVGAHRQFVMLIAVRDLRNGLMPFVQILDHPEHFPRRTVEATLDVAALAKARKVYDYWEKVRLPPNLPPTEWLIGEPEPSEEPTDAGQV